MTKITKTVSVSIAVGFVLLIALFFATLNYSENDSRSNLDSIISRIESYNESNHALPEAMSQLNFEQTINGYLYKGKNGTDIRF